MATLLKFARQGRMISTHLLRSRRTIAPLCHISTTGKQKDSHGTSLEPQIEQSQELKALEEHFADADPTKMKNWISYQWSEFDRDEDTFTQNIAFFLFVTIGCCWGAFILGYFPDYKLRDWGTREAYLEMERRERTGLPIIDPYMVPSETVVLPSEEEIGDQEIII